MYPDRHEVRGHAGDVLGNPGSEYGVLQAELNDEFPATDIGCLESNGHDRESDGLWIWATAILEYLEMEWRNVSSLNRECGAVT